MGNFCQKICSGIRVPGTDFYLAAQWLTVYLYVRLDGIVRRYLSLFTKEEAVDQQIASSHCLNSFLSDLEISSSSPPSLCRNTSHFLLSSRNENERGKTTRGTNDTRSFIVFVSISVDTSSEPTYIDEKIPGQGMVRWKVLNKRLNALNE